MKLLHRRASLVAFVLAARTLAPVAASANPVPVTVTITSIECTQDEECDAAGIEAAGESWPDFYARIFIDGVSADTPRADDDLQKVEPFGWTFSRTLDDATAPAPLVPITIQIWDHDSTSGDDLADASPKPDNNNFGLVLDLTTGRWSGDTTTSCVTGDGVDTDDDEYYPVKVCFDISVASTSGDLDGDGLLDGWETSGLDADGDGTVDVDLPAMGASPSRQDIFLELDYEVGRAPTRDGINAMRRAFAASPRPNPDGTTGITLHVDAGPLFDAGADEAGRTGTCSNGLDDDGDGLADGLDTSCFYLDASREVGVGDCGNGIDDDGDGLADAVDPQCLVGDNLGGGSFLTTVGACGLDGSFATAKGLQFNPNRAWAFHYAIQAAAPPNPAPPAAPLNCLGGQGELGGNDFISHNLDAGTLMHELGHNLNLDHGGSNAMNCKPNYLSVMNYNLQGGIPRNAGGFVLDYSPPRIALNGSARAPAPVATLVENALSEAVQVDLADFANSTVFMNGLNQIVTVPANIPPNWTGDATLPTAAGVNIDTGIPATAGPGGAPAVGAPGCANPDLDSTLVGDNDWARVALAFRQFGASASGALVPHPEQTPTQEEIDQLQADIRRTDLAVVLSATPDPAAAGTAVSYTATVRNDGPNPALAVLLDVAVPVETARAGVAPPGCSELAPGMLSCDLGTLQAGESRTLGVMADVPPSLVYDAGAPLTITANASVANRAGTESDPPDNATTVPVTAVAVADLSIGGLVAPNPPLRMRIGEQVVVEIASTVASAGPSSPMDTVLTFSATADAGATVSPTLLATGQAVLLAGEQRGAPNYPILVCRSPGRHVFAFDHRIDPARAPDSDPAGANNTTSLTISVECEGSEDVVINLQPGRFPNRVMLGTREASLAILTTAPGEYGRAAGFNAADVLIDSLRIGTRRMLEGSEPGSTTWAGTVLDDSFEAVPPETTQDGDRDLMIFTFDVNATGLRLGDTEVCVVGLFLEPGTGEKRDFFGCDAALVEP